MKTLIITLFFCLYAYHVPTPLEAWIRPEYRTAELKRKVPKRKKEVPSNWKAPYPINSSINGRKVNTFNRQSQCPNKRTEK